jgi:hypothetical protein
VKENLARERGTVELTGIWAALLTPLTDEGRVELAALAEHAAALVDEGVDGLVPLGTTGEFCELSRDERTRIIDATVTGAADRVPVLAGITGLSTPRPGTTPRARRSSVASRSRTSASSGRISRCVTPLRSRP